MAKVALLLTDGFADWEYAQIAGLGGAFFHLDIRFVTPAPGRIRSQGGLIAEVPEDLETITTWHPEVVVVVGGTIWESEVAPDVSAPLMAAYRRGATIAGICGGTLALARAGFLDTVPHTSNEPNFLGRHVPGYEGSDIYLDQPTAVSAQRIVTAPGTAPVSFSAAVFEAAGVGDATVAQYRAMMAAEHGAPGRG